MLAHAGAAAVILSFAAHAFATRATLTLPPGTMVETGDAFGRPWRLVNQGLSRFDASGADVIALAVEVTGPDGVRRLVTSESRDYVSPTGRHLGMPVGRRGSIGGALQRVRLLLESADGADVAQVRIAFVPLVILWPVGLLLLMVSALMALAPPTAAQRAPARTE